MKKIILTALVGAGLLLGVAPQSNAAVVVIVHHRYHHRHRVVVVVPAVRRTVLVPGHWRGPFWHRVWVPAHYVPA